MNRYILYKAYIVVAMFLFTLSACKEETNDNSSSLERNYAFVGSLTDFRNADGSATRLTRTTIDSLSTWFDMYDREITLYLDGTMYDNYNVASNGKISASFGPFFYNGIAAFTDVRAWRPNTGTDSLKYFSVLRDQTKFKYIEASDLCYGVISSIPGSDTIHFYHKMAQLELHCMAKLSLVTRDTSFVYNVPLQWLKIAGSRLGGTFDMGNPYYTSNPATNGIVAKAGTEDTITCFLADTAHLANGDTSYTYKSIIFPQETRLEFIARAMDSIFAGSVELHDYKEGMFYNANITVRPRYELSFGSPTWKVGQYLCANKYGKMYAFDQSELDEARAWGILPIGVIFNVGTSKADSAMGWTHGYAMALENAASGVQWGTNITTYALDTIHQYHTWDSARIDLNGYHATMQIAKRGDFASQFHAAYYARNYEAARKVWPLKYLSSGWYLPTNGQWGLILKNLAGIPEPPTGNNYVVGASHIARAKINSYLSGVDGYVAYDEIEDNTSVDINFWCCGEDDDNRGNATAVRFLSSASSVGSYTLTFIGCLTKGSTLGSGYLFNTRPVISF